MQGSLFTLFPIRDELGKKFWRFHEENPKVYFELRKLALELLQTGRERYGIGGLFEVLRWHRALKTTGDDFKLCNSYRAYYARLLIHLNPELEEFFILRRSRADYDPEFSE